MIKSFLPPEYCARCRYCCVFSDADLWEVPNSIATLNQRGDGLYACQYLSEIGCDLPRDNRPLDCRYYPFRVMKYDGGLVIAVAAECKYIAEHNTDRVPDDIAENLIAATKNNLLSINDFKPNYKILRKIESI